MELFQEPIQQNLIFHTCLQLPAYLMLLYQGQCKQSHAHSQTHRSESSVMCIRYYLIHMWCFLFLFVTAWLNWKYSFNINSSCERKIGLTRLRRLAHKHIFSSFRDIKWSGKDGKTLEVGRNTIVAVVFVIRVQHWRDHTDWTLPLPSKHTQVNTKTKLAVC